MTVRLRQVTGAVENIIAGALSRAAMIESHSWETAAALLGSC